MEIEEVLQNGKRRVSVHVGPCSTTLTASEAIDSAHVLLSLAQDMLPQGTVSHEVINED